MLNIETYNKIVKNSNLNKQEKIDVLLTYLNRNELKVVEGKLTAFTDYNYYQDMRYSSSLIKVNKSVEKTDKTQKIVFDVIEHQLVLDKIISLINSICLEEDRLIFIDRKINRYSIKKIMDKYYLSQNLYYQVMNNCYNDISSCLCLIF